MGGRRLTAARDLAEAVLTYALHPQLLPDLGRRVASRLGGRTDPLYADLQRAAASRWCDAIGESEATVLTALGLGEVLESVALVQPQVWNAAVERAAPKRAVMGGAAHVDLLFTICRRAAATKVIETGVAHGWSSLAILLAMKNQPTPHLMSGDLPYLRLFNRAPVGDVVPEEMRQHWTLVRRADRQFLPSAVRQHAPFDVAHYDSDKSFSGRLFGYHWMWQGLRAGGILLSDDVSDNLAFKLFAELVDKEPFVVKSGSHYVGVISR